MRLTKPGWLFLLSLSALFLIATTCNNVFSQAKAVITAPAKVDPGDLVILSSEGSTGDSFQWELIGSDKTFLAVNNNTQAVFASGSPGTYYFLLATSGIDESGKAVIDTTVHTLIVGSPTPTPTPTPDDGDEEDADDVPFPSTGLVVLLIHEKMEVGLLPESQKAIFTSQKIQRYLSDNCLKLSDNNPGFRIWDDDYTELQLRETPELLQSAYEVGVTHFRSNGEKPWIIISNGKTGTSEALPTTVDETLSLLQRFTPN